MEQAGIGPGSSSNDANRRSDSNPQRDVNGLPRNDLFGGPPPPGRGDFGRPPPPERAPPPPHDRGWLGVT